MMRGLILALAALAIPGLPANAQAPEAVTLSDAERSTVKRIESYVNDLTTVRARFIQVSTDGSYAEGTFRLQRPGHLRIDYDPPSQILIITRGDFLVYQDKAVEQVTHIPIDSTPAGLLVSKNLSLFSKDLTITGYGSGDGLLRLTLVRTESPADGSLTLIFNENPLILRQWVVTDAQGISTTVTLLETEFGVKFDPDVFVFRDPNIFGNEGN